MSGPERPRLAELAPGGLGALWPVVIASGTSAIGMVLVAESVARQLAALATGGDAAEWLVLGALGVIVRAGAVWALAVAARRAAIRAKAGLRRRMLRRIVAGDPAGGGTTVLATEGLDALDDYYGTAVPAIISAVVVPLVVGLRVLGADLVSTVVLALTIPLVPVFMILIGMHTRDRVDRASDALTRLADHLVELARGLPVLVGLGRLEEQLTALDGIQSDYRRRTLLTLRTAFLSALALELIATISVAVVAVFLGIRLLTGEVGLDIAVLVLLLAPECFTALRDVGAAFHSSQDGLSALRRVRAALGDGRVATVPASGAPALDAVSVRYAGRDAALESVTVRPVVGRITALSGPSGCGKSTALAALVGALPTDAVVSGAVTGDTARTGYAAQTPRFASENLADELELAGVDAHAATALADELGIGALLRVPLAELSPGERRRAGLARAFARVDRGATLLVLDEPTAHLDADAAERVREAVRRRADRVATLLVTHEAATLALADDIVTLGEGRPQAVGTETRPPAEPAHAEPIERRVEPHTDSPRNAWRALGTVLAASPWRWAGAAGLASLAIGLGMALTAVSGWLIVRASEMPSIMYLLVAIVGVRFFGIARPIARYAERLLAHDAVFRATDALRLRLWRRLAAQGPAMRGLLGGGAALDVLVTEPAELREQLPRILPPAAAGLVAVVGVGVTTSILAPELAPTVWLMLLATSVAAAVGGLAATGAAARERVAVRSALVRRVSALGEAADELRGTGLANAAVARIDALDEQLTASERRHALASGLGSALALAGCAGLAVLAPALAPASMPVATVAIVSLLALALVEGVDGIAAAARRVPSLLAVLRSLAPVLAAPAETGGTRVLDGPIAQLELRGLARVLPGAGAPLFEGVDARLVVGERVRIDGPSGSGKSTLIAMITGALPPDAGAVLADGVPVAQLDHRAWSRHVAWCPQEAHVFDSSIRGNLLIARDRLDPVDDDELGAVLERVGLGPLLDAMPDGLATRVGQAGRALSGGERQRLAVARALLSRAELLVLDEPTAHLDEPTAHALMADIRAASEDRMVVLVSHRADDHGVHDRVVELGAARARTAASVG